MVRGVTEGKLPEVVAEELLQAGDDLRGSFEGLPPEDQQPEQTRAAWRLIIIFAAVTAAFIFLCGSALLGVFPSDLALPLPLLLGVLFALWLVVGFGALDRAVKLGHMQFSTPLLGHWPLFRWIYFLGAVFGPVLGALGNWRASRDTVAAVYLILALGWPAMYVSATFALSPTTSLFEVVLAGEKQKERVELRPEDHFTPFNSLFLVYGGGGVLWAVMLLVGLGLRQQQRKRARAAAEASAEPEILAEGEALLQGEVELVAGAAFAVRCELFQNGKESQDTDGDWTHWWVGDHQQITVNPFYIRLSSGARVRVEADPQILFRHPMTQALPVHRTRRRRVAELLGGERVSATGRLVLSTSSKDQVTDRWLLKPAEHSQMIISSTPLDRPFWRRARIYGMMSAWVMLAGVVGHLLLAPYHLSLWSGERVEAMVQHTSFKHGQQEDSDTFTVKLRLPGESALQQEIGALPEEIWSKLDEGSTLPVRLASAWPSRYSCRTVTI